MDSGVDKFISNGIMDKDSNSQDGKEASSAKPVLPRKKIKCDILIPEGLFDGVVKQCRNSLELFPEELWELILDKLEDSADVQSVLAAFPELSDCLHRKKTSWLFKEVFPFIFNLTCHDFNEVLRCRQVSKRWCSAVDNFLEEHPFKRPYNQNGITRRSVPYREFSFYQPLQDSFPAPFVRTTEDVRSFHNVCRGSTGNPFIRRTLDIERFQEEDPDEFLDAVVALLEEFGDHIWEISLDLGQIYHDDLETSVISFMKIVQCLSSIPNVRCLSLQFEFREPFSYQIATFPWEIPPLPNLDTIMELEVDYDDDEPHLYDHSIVKRYCRRGTIKKFVTSISLCDDRNIGFFSSVRDLCIFVDEFEVESNLANILSFCSTNLKRLQLTCRVEETTLDISQLFKLLQSANIPLEELEFLYFNPSSNYKAGPRTDAISRDHLKSLRFLRVSDAPGLKFDFLKALPSLQSVHFHSAFTPNEDQQVKEEWKKSISSEEMTFTALVRSYMYGAHVPAKWDVWSELPTVNLITFESDTSRVRYARECGNKRFSCNLDVQTSGDVVE